MTTWVPSREHGLMTLRAIAKQRRRNAAIDSWIFGSDAWTTPLDARGENQCVELTSRQHRGAHAARA
mgnify:CR=1 FL=1